jgi:TonB family protein
MFRVLLYSAAQHRERGAAWTAASAFAHATLIGAAVAVTTRGKVPAHADQPIPDFVYVSPRPSVPTRSAESDAKANVPTIPPLEFSLPSLPRVDFDQPSQSFTSFDVPSGRGVPTPAASEALPTNGVYMSLSVDRTVVPHADNPAPDYPSMLRAASVEGAVVVRFVVDSLGRVEPASIEVLYATHGRFAEAVRRWLPRTRYTAAELAGHPVRQLVEQRVGFVLTR